MAPQLKVQVWIYSRTKEGEYRFLLLHMVPERGGFWQPVTGGVESGEEISKAALREAQEETALSFVGELLDLKTSFEFQSPRGICIEHAFALETDVGSPVPKLDQQSYREHSEFRWGNASETIGLVAWESNKKIFFKLLDQLGVDKGSAAEA